MSTTSQSSNSDTRDGLHVEKQGLENTQSLWQLLKFGIRYKMKRKNHECEVFHMFFGVKFFMPVKIPVMRLALNTAMDEMMMTMQALNDLPGQQGTSSICLFSDDSELLPLPGVTVEV